MVINSASAEITVGTSFDTGSWPAGTTFAITVYNVRVT